MTSTEARRALPLRRLAWEARAAWERMGTLELLALALLLLWAGMALQVNRPLQALVVAARDEQVLREAAVPGTAPLRARVAPDVALLPAFPATSQREAGIERVHGLATDAGLTLERLEYRREALKALPVERLSIRLNALGPYAAQRRFLHQLLQRFDNVAIARIALDQEKGSVGSLRAAYDLQLYFRSPP